MNLIARESSHMRVGVCRYMPACMVELGLDPARLLNDNGLSPELLQEPENLVPISKIAAVAEQAARESSCTTFGLMVGLSGGLHSIGPIAHEMTRAGTLGKALAILCSSFSLYNRGARLDFKVTEDVAELRYIILDPSIHSGEQLSEGSIAVAFNVIRQLCPEWRASCVCLPRSTPANPAEFVEAFGSKVVFNSLYASLRFRASFCERAVAVPDPNADVSRFKLDVPVAEAVSWACVRRLLEAKDTSSHVVARDLGLSRRTLHRRLHMEGTSFRHVLQSARFGAAERLLRDTKISMTTLALSFGYSELSAFTRAFHRYFGFPPSAVRSRNRPCGALEDQHIRH